MNCSPIAILSSYCCGVKGKSGHCLTRNICHHDEALNKVPLQTVHTLQKMHFRWTGLAVCNTDIDFSKQLLNGNIWHGERKAGGKKECFKDYLKTCPHRLGHWQEHWPSNPQPHPKVLPHLQCSEIRHGPVQWKPTSSSSSQWRGCSRLQTSPYLLDCKPSMARNAEEEASLPESGWSTTLQKNWERTLCTRPSLAPLSNSAWTCMSHV